MWENGYFITGYQTNQNVLNVKKHLDTRVLSFIAVIQSKSRLKKGDH